MGSEKGEEGVLEHWDFGGSQCYQYLQAQSPIFYATYLYPFPRNGP